MAACSVVLIMCIVFLFLDDTDDGKNKTIYASIVTFIIGKWTGFLVTQGAKSRSKELRKVMQGTIPPLIDIESGKAHNVSDIHSVNENNQHTVLDIETGSSFQIEGG